MKRILARAGLTTLISVIGSTILTAVIVYIVMPDALALALVIATFVPLAISFPIGFIFQKQAVRLKDAHLELQKAHTQLSLLHTDAERRARHDLMTGIFNREHFLSSIGTFRRRSDSGALLIIDADHFKTINDTYGHPVGDDALHAIVGAISGALRQSDIVGRIGGEEFAAFLPGARPDEASLVAERIRQSVENTPFSPVEGVNHPLTVSIGGAIVSPQDTVRDLMHTADRCMYEAKRLGRNKVVFETEAAG